MPPNGLHDCAVCQPVAWGEPWELGSAAFWAHIARSRPKPVHLALGKSLRDEVAACVLGGFRVRGDVGVAAHRALERAGVLEERPCSSEAVERVLRQPLRLRDGRVARYPFPAQRARRIAAALNELSSTSICRRLEAATDARERRDALCALPGVGPKTASWITRNQWEADAVAVIDVHVRRAGIAAGVFCPSWRLPNDYQVFERAFVAWAQRGSVAVSSLDVAIWSTLTGGLRNSLVAPPVSVRLSIEAWNQLPSLTAG